MSLYDSGVRQIVDDYLIEKSKEVRDYGDYWSASSAGYCMRKVIFDRMRVTQVKEDPRKQRVFTVGHIFHSWFQELTEKAGVSVSQEGELINDKIMVKGHYDDIIETDNGLILYDYKTQNSRAFSYKRPEMSRFHKMQLGTYLYMLKETSFKVTEARILKISKDDLRMNEEVLMYTPDLEKEVFEYWSTLNGYWKNKKLPACTCADYEGGFMAKEAYNPYYFQNSPCSLEWYRKWKLNKENNNE
jgi:hypothetical protein